MPRVKKKAAVRRRVEEIKNLIDPNASRKAEREAENALLDYEEMINERYAYAEKIMEAQDGPTLEALEAMADAMTRMAGPARFVIGGVAVGTDEHLASIQRKNFY